jgi:DNA-binding response OmpR family regulator
VAIDGHHWAVEEAPAAHVLIVDDDLAIRTSLERALRLEGFAVATAAGGLDALEAVAASRVDVLVLDVSMPDLDGVTVTTRLRAQGRDLPILILSARSEVEDRVAGLQAGADDYLVKPFAVSELVARLGSLLRRQRVAVTGAPGTPTDAIAHDADVLRFADLVVDPRRRLASRGGEPLTLTRREFDLLETLTRNAGIVLSRTQLLLDVWGYDFEVESNVVDVFAGYLRRKLEAGGRSRLIHTVRGIGFVLRVVEP